MLDLALGLAFGYVLFTWPAFVICLGLLAAAFWLAPPGAHGLFAAVLPVTVYSAWLWGRPIDFIYLRSWAGVALTVVAFLAVGFATRIPRGSRPRLRVRGDRRRCSTAGPRGE